MSDGYTSTIYAHAYGGYYAPVGGVEPTTSWARLEAIDESGKPIADEVHDIRQVAPVRDLSSRAYRGSLRAGAIFRETEILEHASGKLGFPVGKAYVVRLGRQVASSELREASRKSASGCAVALAAGAVLAGSVYQFL